MATVAELIVRVGVNNRDVERGFAEATRRANAFGDALSSTGTRLSIAVTAPLVGLAGASIKAASDLQNLRKGLEAVAGSAGAAQQQYARLIELAKAPGIGFEEAIRGSVRLQAVGFSALSAERGLKAFANAIALTGGGRDNLNRVTVQLGQLAAKGKVLAQDLRPIIENAPAVGTALRDAFGTIDSEAIQALNLTTEQFFDRLFTSLEKLPQVTGGASNAWENFLDSGKRALAGLSEEFLPALTTKLNALADRITVAGDAFRSLSPETRRIIVTLGGIAAAAGPAALAVSALVRAYQTLAAVAVANAVVGSTAAFLALVPAIRSVRDATYLLGVGFRGLVTFLTGPAGIAIAITSVVALLIRAKIRASEAAQSFRDEVAGMNRSLAEFRFGAISEELSTVNAEISRLQALQRNTTGGAFAGKTGFQDEAALRRARELNEAQARRNTLLEQLRVITGRISELNRGDTPAVTPEGNNFGTGRGEDGKKQKTFLQQQQEIVEALAEGARLGTRTNQERALAFDLERSLLALSRETNRALDERNGLLRLSLQLRETTAPDLTLATNAITFKGKAPEARSMGALGASFTQATREARRFEDTLEQIASTGRGLSSIFRAFASVSDRIFGKMSQVVDAIAGDIGNLAAQLKEFGASSFTSLAQALTSGPALGAIGSIVSIGATLGNALLGQTQADRERAARDQQLIEALDALRLKVEGFQVTGASSIAIQNAVARLAREASFGGSISRSEVNRQIEDMGVTFAQIVELARSLGLEILTDNGRLAVDTLKELSEAIGINVDLMTRFGTALDDVIRVQTAAADIFDLPNDPQRLLSESLGRINQLAPNIFQQFFAGLSDNAAINSAITDLFKFINVPGNLTAEMLGRFTDINQLLDELLRADDALDGMADAAERATAAMLNVPVGFKVSQARFEAILREGQVAPQVFTPPATPGSGGAQPFTSFSVGTLTFSPTFSLSGNGVADLDAIRREIRREADGNPAMEPLAQLWGI